MMDLSVLVPPLVEPITIEAAFVELRLGMPGDDFAEHPDYNAVLGKMRAATQHCEDLTGRAFVQQTLRLSGATETLSASARCRGRSWWSGGGVFDLLRPPVQSIVAVGYIDTDGAEQTLDEADYYVVSGNTPQLRWASGYTLPSLYDRPDALRIDYLAGYPPGTPADDYDPEDPPQYLADRVPAPIGQACLLTLRLLFENMDPSDREATERARDALLWPYKVLRV
jgi:hypothetical protein